MVPLRDSFAVAPGFWTMARPPQPIVCSANAADRALERRRNFPLPQQPAA